MNFVEIRVESVAEEAVLIKHSVSVLGPLLDKCLGRADKSVQSGVPVSQEDLGEKDEVTRLTAGFTAVLSVGRPAGQERLGSDLDIWSLKREMTSIIRNFPSFGVHKVWLVSDRTLQV